MSKMFLRLLCFGELEVFDLWVLVAPVEWVSDPWIGGSLVVRPQGFRSRRSFRL